MVGSWASRLYQSPSLTLNTEPSNFGIDDAFGLLDSLIDGAKTALAKLQGLIKNIKSLVDNVTNNAQGNTCPTMMQKSANVRNV